MLGKNPVGKAVTKSAGLRVVAAVLGRRTTQERARSQTRAKMTRRSRDNSRHAWLMLCGSLMISLGTRPQRMGPRYVVRGA